MKISAIVTGTLFSVSTLTLSNPVVAKDGEIVIGMAYAKTGWMEAYDGDGAKMAELWIERVNASGGIGGKKIKLLTADTKTDRVEAAKAGQRLVSEGVDLLIVSADYDYGSPTALQGQKAGVVSVSLGAGDPKMGVVGIGPLVFTSAVAAQLEGATMADWGIEKKGFKKGYELIDDINEYSKSVCAGYKWAFGSKAKVVGSDSFKLTDAAVNAQVTRLAEAVKNDGVDNVMVCFSGTPAASVIRQIRAAGITIPIMSGTSMDGTYWVNSVPDLKDFYLPTSALPQGDSRPEVNKITEAFKAKYGSVPSTQYPYPIYAWLDLWRKAVEATGTTDTKAVVTELETYSDVPTVLGLRSFSPKLHIQTRSPLLITGYADGKQAFVEEWRIPTDIPAEVLYRTKK
ncbi:ABC transporter substrate-binding protein [Agrobacterium sp. SOY23]|uniref:ABC transporter substrate-binding protein n=1 Tax=Agrobacterium sp. SOY23 TaxID=3014555 RepID=UPI0022AFD8F8|nr:ABC transporter substrate-binding protein [Agrobacterium sp. SOY23]MCZ4433056.1 ABC transporter substrate-binding protein [Agrobacterium sp. SOY23]